MYRNESNERTESWKMPPWMVIACLVLVIALLVAGWIWRSGENPPASEEGENPPASEEVVLELIPRTPPLVNDITAADGGGKEPPPTELQDHDVIGGGEGEGISDASLSEIATIPQKKKRYRANTGATQSRLPGGFANPHPPLGDGLPYPQATRKLTPEQQQCWDRYEEKLEQLVSAATIFSGAPDAEFSVALLKSNAPVIGDRLLECLAKCPVTGIDRNAEAGGNSVGPSPQKTLQECFQDYLDSPETSVYGVKPCSWKRMSQCFGIRGLGILKRQESFWPGAPEDAPLPTSLPRRRQR